MQDLHPSPAGSGQTFMATIVVSFVLLLAATVLTLRISKQADEADRWVVHTLEVKQQIAQLAMELATAESGQRGYLITREESFLAPFKEARRLVPPQIMRLRDAVADNAEQQARVAAVQPLIEDRLATIAQVLESFSAGRGAESVQLVRTRGSYLMRDIRVLLDAMDAAESELLAGRRAEVASIRAEFATAVTFMLVASALLSIFSLIGVRRYLNTLHASRQQLAMYNSELEAKVAERTSELATAAEVANRERRRAEALLTDVNHRVGNNLALVSSFLTMQQRTVRNPEAARALNAARTRVQAIASAHRKLRLGADFASVKANEVLGAVLDDICAGLPAGDLIRVNYDVAPLEINARDAVSLGVLTSELVMNAIKHAFSPGEAGEIHVVFGGEGTNVPYLEVTDDGVGWHEKNAADSNGPGAEGLGARIIEMVARQFGGTPQRSARRDDPRRPGTRVRIDLGRLQLMPSS